MTIMKQVAAIVLTGMLVIIVITGCSADKDAGNTTSADLETDTTSVSIVKIENAKPGDYVQFGSYEQDNNTTNGKEAILWQVLSLKDGSVFLLANKILDAKSYNYDFIPVSWESCSLRMWLNSDFLNSAFSEDEQALIVKPEKIQVSTEDRVFLLSYDEAAAYFKDDAARTTQGTVYSESRGLYVRINNPNKGNSWWLRSTTESPVSTFAFYIDDGGGINSVNGDVHNARLGVRPALWIKS